MVLAGDTVQWQPDRMGSHAVDARGAEATQPFRLDVVEPAPTGAEFEGGCGCAISARAEGRPPTSGLALLVLAALGLLASRRTRAWLVAGAALLAGGAHAAPPIPSATPTRVVVARISGVRYTYGGADATLEMPVGIPGVRLAAAATVVPLVSLGSTTTELGEDASTLGFGGRAAVEWLPVHSLVVTGAAEYMTFHSDVTGPGRDGRLGESARDTYLPYLLTIGARY